MKIDDEKFRKTVVNFPDRKERSKDEYMSWLMDLWEQAQPELNVSGHVINVDFAAWRAEILSRDKKGQ
jgi:hypothetical protein